MAYLDRAAIIAAQDLNYQDVEVPEWGGMVRVCSLSATQRDQLSLMVVSFDETLKAAKDGSTIDLKLDRKGLAEMKAQVIVWTVSDDSGKRLFRQSDLDAVGLKAPEVIDRLYDIAIELSGATDFSMRTISKNSGTGPSAGSDSA